jgi:hypothetical protein
MAHGRRQVWEAGRSGGVMMKPAQAGAVRRVQPAVLGGAHSKAGAACSSRGRP